MTGEARAISGSEEASYPFWSPDSRSLAFFGSSKLLTVSIAGGLPEAVADIQQGRGGTWTDNGVILFTPRGGGVVHRVGEGGGAVEVVTALDASRGRERALLAGRAAWRPALPVLRPQHSAREQRDLSRLAGRKDAARAAGHVTVERPVCAAPRRRPGHVLWVRDGELLAQPLDIEGRRLDRRCQDDRVRRARGRKPARQLRERRDQRDDRLGVGKSGRSRIGLVQSRRSQTRDAANRRRQGDAAADLSWTAKSWRSLEPAKGTAEYLAARLRSRRDDAGHDGSRLRREPGVVPRRQLAARTRRARQGQRNRHGDDRRVASAAARVQPWVRESAVPAEPTAVMVSRTDGRKRISRSRALIALSAPTD